MENFALVLFPLDGVAFNAADISMVSFDKTEFHGDTAVVCLRDGTEYRMWKTPVDDIIVKLQMIRSHNDSARLREYLDKEDQ